MRRLDISIGTRLALGFGMTLLLMLAAMTFYLVRDQMQYSATEYLADRVMLRADAAADLESALLLQSGGARNYVYSGDRPWLDAYTKGRTEAADAISRLEQLPKTPEGTDLFYQIKPLLNNFTESTEAAVSLKEQGRTAEAQQMLDGAAHTSQGTLLDLTGSFQDLQMRLRDQTKAELAQIRESTVRDSIALAAGALLLSTLLAYSTARSIRRPVQALVSASDRLARGDYQGAISTAGEVAPFEGGNRHDEISVLASRFAMASADLAARERQLQAHARLATALASTLEVNRLAEDALIEIASYVGAERGAVFVVEEAGAGTVELASYPHASRGLAGPSAFEELVGEAAHSLRAVFRHGDSVELTPGGGGGTRSSTPGWETAVPMVSHERCIGVVLFAGTTPPDKAQTAFMEEAAARLAVTLENAFSHEVIRAQNEEIQAQNEELQSQSEEIQAQNEELLNQAEDIQSQNEELQTQNEELETQSAELSEQKERLAEQAERITRLQEVAQRLSDSLFPNAVLDGVVRAARDLTGATLASVLLLDESGEYFTVAAEAGLDAERAAVLRLPRTESVAGQVIQKRRTVFYEDTSNASEVRFPQLAGGESVGAIIVAPMIARGEPLGVVEIYYPSPREIPASDVEMMSALGSAAAVAVHNSQLYDNAVRNRLLTEGVLAGIPEAVVVVDTHGWVTMANAPASEMFGISEGQRLEMPADKRFVLGRAELAQIAGRAMSGESVREHEVQYTRVSIDGFALAAAAPIRQDGIVVRVVIVAADITHLKAIEKARDEFFSVASHELKSPMTSVKGYAQLLQRFVNKGAERDELVKMAQVIVDHSDRVVEQVNRLLDLSRAQLGGLDMRPEAIDLVELIRRQVEAIQVRTGKHRLTTDLSGDLTGRWDKEGLTQVVTNLLENAVRYSPNGGEVRVSATRRGNGVLIEVTDEGIGIPPEAHDRVFDRHFRTDVARKVRADGMGIGLYLVRQIVTAHGGTITVRSQEGEGSTFSVLLPLSV